MSPMIQTLDIKGGHQSIIDNEDEEEEEDVNNEENDDGNQVEIAK
jgi:hypothetical protein